MAEMSLVFSLSFLRICYIYLILGDLLLINKLYIHKPLKANMEDIEDMFKNDDGGEDQKRVAIKKKVMRKT